MDTIITDETPSQRRIVIALLLGFFMGSFGAHRFYVGRLPSAITILILHFVGWFLVFTIIGLVIAWIFFIVVGLWNLVDLIILLLGRFRDEQNRKLTIWW